MGKYIADLALRFIRENNLGPDTIEFQNPPSSADMNPHWFYKSVKEKLQAWFKKKRFTTATLAKIATAGRSFEDGQYYSRASIATVLGCEVYWVEDERNFRAGPAGRFFELSPRAMLAELAMSAVAAEVHDELICRKYAPKT